VVRDLEPLSEEWADLYELVYAGQDNAPHAEYVRKAIVERLPDASTLLDVACGTGWHLEHFARSFEVEGVDASPGMLAHARARLPETPLHRADMRSFDLGRRFDAVTCLSSSIAWMLTTDDLRDAIGAMARHLAVGGVLVIEPWPAPGDDPEMDVPWATTARDAGRTLALLETTTLRGGVWVQEAHYLIADDRGIRHLRDLSEMGAFTRVDLFDAFASAGLSADFDEKGPLGRGLYIAQPARTA
jgi:SAM-dependent methyltransferase